MQTAVQISSDGDVVRARARGVLGTLASVVRLEGPSKLYCGLVPGLQRQMVSTVQHSTVQYSTVQYSTVQYSVGCNRCSLLCVSGCTSV